MPKPNPHLYTKYSLVLRENTDHTKQWSSEIEIDVTKRGRDLTMLDWVRDTEPKRERESLRGRENWDRSTSRMSALPVPAQPQRCFSRQFNKAKRSAPLIMAGFSASFGGYLLTECGGKNFPLKAAAQAHSHCRYKKCQFPIKSYFFFSIFKWTGAVAVEDSARIRFTAVQNVLPVLNACHSK